ncbi:MAG: response regulator [Gammaproteobacteria bacterium]|nr:response regulator [Gammaproteobacteria bacterium]
MNIDPALLRQLLETFRIELDELLPILSEGVLALEHEISSKEKTDKLNAMLRACHNIKGASRGIGLLRISDLAHRIEDLFSLIQKGERDLTRPVANISLTAIDTLKLLVSDDLGGEGDDNPLRPEQEKVLSRLGQACNGEVIAEDRVVEEMAEPPPPPPPVAGSDSVRLPVGRLNRIAALADELQLTGIRLEQHLFRSRRINEVMAALRQQWKIVMAQSSVGAGYSIRNTLADTTHLILEAEELTHHLEESIRTTTSQLRPLALTLKEDVRSLRMIPASTVLKPLERSVRDIAQVAGKEVALVIQGGEIELDRVVLDGLKAPLMHLLRNGIDHGIESPQQRQKSQKSAIGTITISVSREGGAIHLVVEDDGGGIDHELIRGRAISQGLATEEEMAEMGSELINDLIFRPGFTSRSEVSEISGRGVGLDVVRINMQSLQGQVQMETTPGRGTRFILTVPLSMASEHGLIVSCSGQRFIIFSQYIQHILEIPHEQIQRLGEVEVIEVGSQPIPLRPLRDLIGLKGEGKEPGEFLEIVVINHGWQQMALVVDQVMTERDIVTRPLAPPLDQLNLYEGGVVGGSSSVILVLNIASLFATMQQRPPEATHFKSELQNESQQYKILIVDDSITTRTLEKGILETNGYQVETAKSGEEALEFLQQASVDLVITDVEMPGINGFELTETIRTQLGLVDLPIVIVSSLGSDADRQRGVKVKANAYIVKGEFDSRELIQVVSQLI